MASLGLTELKKRDNIEIFLHKWKNNEDFLFIDKQTRKLPKYNEQIADILRSAVKGDPIAINLITRDKNIRKLLPLNQIQKTSEFGGRGGGGGAGVANEKFLIDQLKSFMVSTPVTIAFESGKKTFVVNNVTDVVGAGTDTAGSKKSDVNLITTSGQVPISIKQEDAGGWESSDRLFRDAGTKLIEKLLDKDEIQLTGGSPGDVSLNRVVAMEATVKEQTITVFGSDIIVKDGAIIVRSFRKNDFSYNFSKNRIEVRVYDIYKTLNDIPKEKKPIWVIRNQRGRKSLPNYPGLRTEMKISKYAMSTSARAGRLPPLLISLEKRNEYDLEDDILRY